MDAKDSSKPEEDIADSISDHFGAKADRYAELDVFSREEFYRPLFEAAAPKPGEHALDLACGTGRMALMLSRVAARVVGCDITAEMLKRAKVGAAVAGSDNVIFVEAEASRLPFIEDSFDLVTCRTAFHHFPDPRAVLAEVARVLVPDGRFVIEDVYGPDEAGLSAAREEIEKALDRFHVKAYSIAEMKSMLSEAGLQVAVSSHPETRQLPLEIILRLEDIREPRERVRLETLLRRSLGRDLAGLRIDEVDGQLSLKWETVILVTFAAGR